MTTSSNPHVIFTWSFWKGTIERVLFTFLETYFGLFLFTAVAFNAATFDWLLGLGPALGAAILALVKCILASLGGNAGPSAWNETLTDFPKVIKTS